VDAPSNSIAHNVPKACSLQELKVVTLAPWIERMPHRAQHACSAVLSEKPINSRG
jgi:hypothetical protein